VLVHVNVKVASVHDHPPENVLSIDAAITPGGNESVTVIAPSDGAVPTLDTTNRYRAVLPGAMLVGL